MRDLKRFFDERERRLRQYDRGTPAYDKAAQNISEEVRDRVLKHVMIRRTRSEIEQYYAGDMDNQGLSFPEVQPPRRILYAFDDALETVFNRTIDRIADFTYARYTPLLFYEGDLDPLREQSQRDIGGFMKSILVKRLESSFHAFKRTLSRFIQSYEWFIEMYESGTVYLGRDVDEFDLLDKAPDRFEVIKNLPKKARTACEVGEEERSGLLTFFRREVLRAFVDGVIPENKTRRIKDDLQQEPAPLNALQILREHVPESVLDAQRRRRTQRRERRREVILSAYLQAK